MALVFFSVITIFPKYNPLTSLNIIKKKEIGRISLMTNTLIKILKLLGY